MTDTSAHFRKVTRGYDPTQVDHHMTELAQAAASTWQQAAERTRELSQLKAAHDQLKSDLERCEQRARVLEEAQKEVEEPTYAGLGNRIAAILTQVNGEAYELRARAQADAANSRALAEEHALASRQEADRYARQTTGAADDEAARILEEARAQADSLVEGSRQQADRLLGEARDHAEALRDDADRQAIARQDADREAMARREDAELIYEEARAKAAAAAVDFETTLAARREASALEFAAQVQAAEQQLASVRSRSEQTRREAERVQQETDAKVSQQLEQASSRAQTLVAEAKIKAERIRDLSEREVAAAAERRDSINTQLITVRRDLAALAGGTRFDPIRLNEPTEYSESTADRDQASEVEVEQEGMAKERAVPTEDGAVTEAGADPQESSGS